MAFILHQCDILFSSIPEGNRLVLVLVIILVLLPVIMGIVAVFVYRRWKERRTISGYDTSVEEVPMNQGTVRPAETVS